MNTNFLFLGMRVLHIVFGAAWLGGAVAASAFGAMVVRSMFSPHVRSSSAATSDRCSRVGAQG